MLECVSNKIGGDLIGTALWRGIRLKDLLDSAKVMPGAKYIVFRCSDGYDVGIPLENGMMDGTLLAYDINLAPLTTAHGFPVRAIVPGLYGMMNPKWITDIEIVDSVYEGYWQRNGWTNTADVHTNSSIVIPGQAPLRHRFRKLDETPNIVPGEKGPNCRNSVRRGSWNFKGRGKHRRRYQLEICCYQRSTFKIYMGFMDCWIYSDR